MIAIVYKETILSILCRARKKWGMLADGLLTKHYQEEADLIEIRKAAPWISELPEYEIMLAICEGYVYLFFDTEEEMKNVYNRTVGDDGSTDLNHYNGPWRVYAITCDPDGNLLNENT